MSSDTKKESDTRFADEYEDVRNDSPSDFDQKVALHAPRLRGRKLNAVLAFVAGTGFTLFGYDQGVMSALLTAPQWEKVFPQTIATDSHHATLQSFVVAVYEIGCLVGALSNLWVGDRLGRRRTIVVGGIIMIIGAILQTTSFSYAQMVVARIITGFGNGLNTSTVPAYHAECSSAAKRGSYIMIEGSLITFGIMISYWIDFALFWAKGSSAQWRVPIALQILLALIMICGIFWLPESPRWLVKHGRDAEALAVISALDDKPPMDHEVQRVYHGIREAILVEGKSDVGNKSNLKELFTGGLSQNFRRAALGVIIQCFQQITGINLITYYATLLFERLGLDDVKSRIIAACNGTEYFLASLIAIALIERVGRRKLMLVTAFGQCLTMVLLAILGSIDNSASRIVSTVLLFVFNSIFAVGWLGMTWLYPAEIVGIRIRAPANALSTASNWVFNFMVVMVTGPSFSNINWGTYIVFAALNAFIIPVVYLFFPETAGRLLARHTDMDVIFAIAHRDKVSPVAVSLRKDLPTAGSPEADEIMGISPSARLRHRDRHVDETKPAYDDQRSA
ncbi:hypothetical protein EW146_g6921 [Bondarzewia mesenterica]|uniref:Major facilitator superfamily (MFS) profile domain-containing protein n=1 Tax=Bondarzewia mesenterica TaxID=1095465 RepID=A0A4V3XEE7_9AGAM|nr:hypothetical protein EW146_g6921 [Bondarzewia mesenterica]